MSATTIIAIDPGCSGGIAWQQGCGDFGVEKMPPTITDFGLLIRRIVDLAVTLDCHPVAYIEWQNGAGGVKTNPVSNFKFGKNYGACLGALAALEVRTIMVRPREWMASVGAGTKDKSKGQTVWKNKLKDIAQRLYPGIKVTLATADALLILEHATKQER